MGISCINRSIGKFKNQKLQYKMNCNNSDVSAKTYHISPKRNAGKNVSFGRIHFMYGLRKILNYMKKPSEEINTVINAVGTGMIAPFAIMCSPKKPCSNPKPTDEKKDREKKFFQAVRQPISAVLAFAFTMPPAMAITYGSNLLAYKVNSKMFKDEYLIPDEYYLKEQAKKALKAKEGSALRTEWAEELRMAENQEQMRAGLKKKILSDIEQLGDTISDSELEKRASSKSAIRNYTAEKMAEVRQEKLVQAKIQEMAARPKKFTNLDFVTEDYIAKAKKQFASEFKELKKNSNLNWFDKFLNFLGFQNKKVEAFEKVIEKRAKEKGLTFLREDMKADFSNYMKKLDKFVRTRCAESQKVFVNKRFWISVGVNAIMFGASGLTLNWLHPKLAAFIDKCRGKKPEQAPSTEKKVEVSKCV